MPIFDNWVQPTELQPAPDRILVLREVEDQRHNYLPDICECVADHLLADPLLESIAAMGYDETANVLRGQLPTTKQARSADLGEIFATEYIEEETNFSVPIKRLRFKDHPNMSLRGTDVLGFRTLDEDGNKLVILKAEAKSHQRLSEATVHEAIDDLNDNSGRPSARSLGFIVSLLAAQEREDEWQLIFSALADDIPRRNLRHLVFTLSGNDPSEPLSNPPPTDIQRELTGLHVTDHPEFIQQVFEDIYDTLG